ncbi:MAG: hypothetical protein ACTSQF_08115 [Candidatus Heimdallarchaeaceae archaeon]
MVNVAPKAKLITDVVGTVFGIFGGLCIKWRFDLDKFFLIISWISVGLGEDEEYEMECPQCKSTKIRRTRGK